MDILDCDWRFKFQCPKQWEGLAEGDDPAIRFCATCRRNVYLCMSDAEVGLHASQGHCVAIGFTEGADLYGLMGDIADDWTDTPVEARNSRGRLIGLVAIAVAIAIAACAWLLPRH